MYRLSGSTRSTCTQCIAVLARSLCSNLMAPIPATISSRALNSLKTPIRNRTNEKGSFDDCFLDAFRGKVARATLPWYLSCGLFLGVLVDPNLPRRPQRAGQQILVGLRQPNMCSSVASPAARHRQEDLGLFRDEIGLLFRREHQVAVALFLRSERSENPSADAEVRRAHVRAFLGAGQAQRQPSKVRYSHGNEYPTCHRTACWLRYDRAFSAG